jgi:uncharacterized protein (DUF924 family)
MSSASIDEVLHFWFEELTPKDWFRKDEALDSTIASRFGALYHELRTGVPESWLATPEGYLAAIIVLDQFPRNMFRGDARAFATDEASLALAKRAIAEGLDQKLSRDQRIFLCMPFQHSEDSNDQARAIALYTMIGKPSNLDFALRHQAVVDRFARFPHRNGVLGRISTQEEEEFLGKPGSSF